MRNTKPVLLVEDDSIDAMTVRRAFKDLKLSNALTHRINGEEALAYLREPDVELPCVILLDLNMPRMNGIEFLKVIKQDDRLKSIPVIVLTIFIMCSFLWNADFSSCLDIISILA